MEFFDVIRARYSHKAAFAPAPRPADEDLRRIVEAGMAAPSAMNRQSPEFIIITDAGLLERIGEITNNAVLKTAPAMIAVLGNPVDAEGFYREDYAAATENMLLAATDLGYAVGWIDGIFRNDAVRTPVSTLLGIPDDRRLCIMIPVGKPGEEGARRAKKPFEERASWNTYAIRR
jgi:nitroreductase